MTAAHATDKRPDTAIGQSLRRAGFEVVAMLGRGGMGAVYKARQTRLNRWIALKVISPTLAESAEYLARFQVEAEAAARLQHPNIVQIHEYGQCEGLSYLALEYVEGGTLAQRTDGQPLAAHTAAQIVETLATAIHYAHQCGIIHRDIKPANILLRDREAGLPGNTTRIEHQAIVPKIADFGLAKRLDDQTQHTQSGAILGTPSYMAPEQAIGRLDHIGPVSDIYGLGAVLYELLTGRPPFLASTPLETLQQVVGDEPVPPSRLLPTPRDLETICLKCLSKDPAKRYASAKELADDLGRFRAGIAVRARPAPGWERALRWARRNKASAVAVVLLPAALLGAVVSTVSFSYQVALRERNRDLQGANASLGVAREDAERARDQEKQARQSEADANAELASAKSKIDQLHYFSQVASALGEWREVEIARADAILGSCELQRRHWEWHYVKRLCAGGGTTLRGHTNSVRSVTWSPDGRLVASASLDRSVKVWDAASGKPVLTFRGHSNQVLAVAFRSDGKYLASAGEDRTVQIWDPETGKVLQKLQTAIPAIRTLAFSPDGALLAIGGLEGSKVVDLATGEARLTFPQREECVLAAAFNAKGTSLATGHCDEKIRIWDLSTGKATHALMGHPRTTVIWDTTAKKGIPAFRGVAFSSDGKRLASCGMEVKVWDLATGMALQSFLVDQPHGFHNVSFSPDGQRLLAACSDRTVKVWQVGTGKPPLVLKGHSESVNSAAFSADGKQIASGSSDRTVRLWTVNDQEYQILAAGLGRADSLAFSPDGTLLALSGWIQNFNNPKFEVAGWLRVWNVATGKEHLSFNAHQDRLTRVAFSPDGKFLASASWDKTAKLWDAKTGALLFAWRDHDVPVQSLAFSKDSKLLASGGDHIRLWSTTTGDPVRTLTGHTKTVHALAFSPDGQVLASGSQDSTVRCWEVTTGRELCKFESVGKEWNDVAFHPDGVILAAAGHPAILKAWNTRAGQELVSSPNPHLVGGYRGLAFHPSGNRMAIAGQDHRVRILDLLSGREALLLKGHTAPVQSVAFHPAGDLLASASEDGTVRIWDGTESRTK